MKPITLRDHYEVSIRGSGAQLADHDLQQCEAALGVTFPDQYRGFLLRHNGGKPTPACFQLAHTIAPKIDAFFSIGSKRPEDDLQAECLRLRADFGLPPHFLPIARVSGSGMLLLDCSKQDSGALYYWGQIDDGFHLEEGDYDTVRRLYFSMGELLHKLGPPKNRDDRDGLFFRLYWAASNAQTGGQTVQAIVDAGYDINFVLPTYAHPIFAAMKCDAFAVAQRMVELGARPDHLDREGVRVDSRLDEARTWWNNMLEESPKGDSIHEMALRRLATIDAALALYANADNTA